MALYEHEFERLHSFMNMICNVSSNKHMPRVMPTGYGRSASTGYSVNNSLLPPLAGASVTTTVTKTLAARDAAKNQILANKKELIEVTSAVLRGEVKLPDLKRGFQKDVAGVIGTIDSSERNSSIVESNDYQIIGKGDSKAIDRLVHARVATASAFELPPLKNNYTESERQTCLLAVVTSNCSQIEASKKFGVPVRTIRRDVERLRSTDLGFPAVAVSSKDDFSL
jgi:hypothetical protein